MDTEDGEFMIGGEGGTAEENAFDAVVGVIEDFMITFDMQQVWALVPALHTVMNEHDQHHMYRSFLAAVEKEMDAFVLAACPEHKSIEAIGALLQERQQDISEEVWEYVSDGCFDYQTFIQLWGEQKP